MQRVQKSKSLTHST